MWKRFYLAVFIVFFFLLGASFSSGQNVQLKQTVVVTASLEPLSLQEANREIIVIDSDTLKYLPLRSLDDLFSLLPIVDYRPRSAGGLFGDVSIRGAGSAGVLICIDGIRWNDPQTSHFNMELPVPLMMIERIEILSGSQALLFGSDAVGGVINIITKNSFSTAAVMDASAGSFDTRKSSLFGSVGKDSFSCAISASGNRSDGFMPDRDFRIRNMWSVFSLKNEYFKGTINYAKLDNLFGANRFYGPFPSLEHTKTDAVMGNVSFQKGFFKMVPTNMSFSFKRHRDAFFLFRDNPDVYQNNHTTHTISARLVSTITGKAKTTLSFVAEFYHATMNSSRLGNHNLNHQGAGVELRQLLNNKLLFQGGFRVDNYSYFGSKFTPEVGVSYFVGSSIKLRSSWGRSFRVPNFTERFYWSPSNQGNPGLVPENADSIECGVDWYENRKTVFSLTLYHRWERELVDWIKRIPTDPWKAENIGSVDVNGVSLTFDCNPLQGLRIKGGYNYNNLSSQQNSFVSKYALDYAKHHIGFMCTLTTYENIDISFAAHYKHRVTGEDYFPVSIKLSKKFEYFEIYTEAYNLLGQHYEEVRGVAMPGRSLLVGLRVKVLK